IELRRNGELPLEGSDALANGWRIRERTQARRRRQSDEIDLGRVQTHDPRPDPVDGVDGPTEEQTMRGHSRSHDGTVAFHPFDSVHDRVPDRKRRSELDDRSYDPVHVQEVLRPAVFGARYDTEEVLHAERQAGPVVSFQL